MAISRIWQAGWEMNTVAEWPDQVTRLFDPAISSTKAFTGTYSLRNGQNQFSSVGSVFSSTTQVAAHCYLNHNSTSSQYALIYQWTTTAGNDNYIRWNSSNELELVIDSSIIDSVSTVTIGMSTTDTWYGCGLRVFANGSTGYVNFYLDGTSVLSATSQDTGTGITELFFGGGLNVGNGWINYMYMDDCYIDDTAGEADTAPIPRRFIWAIANGNGATSQWTGSDGNQVNNYELVDDITPDGDTTEVHVSSTGQKDGYTIASITVPTGWAISAAIPTALAKRASTTEQLSLYAFDGSSTSTSTAYDLGADYAAVWDRMSQQPDTTDWNELDFEAMEFGIKSAGTY